MGAFSSHRAPGWSVCDPRSSTVPVADGRGDRDLLASSGTRWSLGLARRPLPRPGWSRVATLEVSFRFGANGAAPRSLSSSTLCDGPPRARSRAQTQGSRSQAVREAAPAHTRRTPWRTGDKAPSTSSTAHRARPSAARRPTTWLAARSSRGRSCGRGRTHTRSRTTRWPSVSPTGGSRLSTST